MITKCFRSLIMQLFPVELLIKLEEISMSYDVDNNTKTPEIKELLEEYNVPYSPLGNGTNRYGILVDGYAVKIALDDMGKDDNLEEFCYAKLVYPYAAKVYECLPNGLISVLEYLIPFGKAEFLEHQQEMREILSILSEKYLIGDVGISSNNYINWGMRSDGTIAILDFAYIYKVSYHSFKCICDDEGILQFDRDFNYLICPYCKKKYTFGDIRRRISDDDIRKEMGNLEELGYLVHGPEEVLEVDPEKSPVKKKKEKKKRIKDTVYQDNCVENFVEDINEIVDSIMMERK